MRFEGLISLMLIFTALCIALAVVFTGASVLMDWQEFLGKMAGR